MYRNYKDKTDTQSDSRQQAGQTDQGKMAQKPTMSPDEAEKKNDAMKDEFEEKEKNADTRTNSLMKKWVFNTKDDKGVLLYDKYKRTVTVNNGILADCIKSGVKNHKSSVGIYACDPTAYTAFKDIFDGVIKDYHKVDKVEHPTPTFGDPNPEKKLEGKAVDFSNLDPEGKMIISTRVRVGRSQKGYGFPPIASKDERVEMEKRAKDALETLKGKKLESKTVKGETIDVYEDDELNGKYYPLTGMDEKDRKQLVEDHFLFKDDDDCLRDAGGYLYWPTGRGIFHNKDKTFLTWINEEDHLRLISMQMGGDLAQVYNRLVKAINKMEKKLEFAKQKELGYITFCPTNLGTTLRASVHIKVPNLQKAGTLQKLCDDNNLQPRGIHGEHTESVGGVYDISNKRRLGLTEFDALMEMKNGVEKIMAAEKALTK